MTKKYTSIIETRTPRPRSKRLREQGIGNTVSHTVLLSGTSGSTTTNTDHTHSNLSDLEKFSIEDGYGLITELEETENDSGQISTEKKTKKIKAGYADEVGSLGDEVLKMLAELFIRKDIDDSVSGTLTFQKLQKFGEFIDSMTAGKGAGIYPNGRAQFESVEVRGYMKVMELIYNRLSAIEGDFVFTESGTVDKVEDLGEKTYRLTIRKRWDNDFTAFDTDDILRTNINKLLSYRESYMAFYRVITKNLNDNTITVVMYDDDQVPAGKNYPPSTSMMMHRWGNTRNTDRQNCWYMSSTEGRLVYLTGVTSPIISDDMYASFYGLPVNLKIFDNKPINFKEPYLYVRGLIAQDIITVDHQGRIQYTIKDRGIWDEETAKGDDPYLFEEKNENTGLYETHDVWLNACRYRCLKSRTKEQPKWNSSDWDEISGDPELWIEFIMPTGGIVSASEDCPISFRVMKGSEDITDDIDDGDIEWHRTTDYPAEDVAWDAGCKAKKELNVKDSDCPKNQDITKFTVVVFVRDGKSEEPKKVTDYIEI